MRFILKENSVRGAGPNKSWALCVCMYMRQCSVQQNHPSGFEDLSQYIEQKQYIESGSSSPRGMGTATGYK